MAKLEPRNTTRIQRGLEEHRGWWDNIFELSFAWTLIALVGCTWLLLPRINTTLPEWSPGDVATFDVTVPRDFTVPDETATETVREEARASVLPVYDYEPRLLFDRTDEIKTLFATCREPRQLETLTPEAIAASSSLQISPDVLNIVIGSECNEEFELALIDVVSQIHRARVIDDEKALERRSGTGLILRNLATGVEQMITLAELSGTIDIRSELEAAIRAQVLEQAAVARRWIRPSVSFLATITQPNLVFNRAETSSRREGAAAQVMPRSQVFQRGQILVRRGDTVTPSVARTLHLLNLRQHDLGRYNRIIGTSLLVAVMLLGWWKIPWRFSGVVQRNRLSMIFILILLFVALNRLALFLGTAVAVQGQNSILSSAQAFSWALPHAAGPMTVLFLFGPLPAVLFAVCAALLAGIMLGGEFTAAVFALVSGLVALFATQQSKDRHGLSRVGAIVGASNVLMLLIREIVLGFQNGVRGVAITSIWAFLSGPIAVGVVTFLLPHLESIFGITTDIRLLELSNQNLPLLRRLSLEAPGTYQHSLAVANLAEAGAEAVGANGLLLRVCSYYHDLGKLVKPAYFFENQRGPNPHDNLAPSMSALVIQSHVKEGLKIAREEKLPLPIRQAVATHHGTKLIRYFYNKAIKETDRDVGEIRESNFRYPGPKPHTKELGILLLADAAEAAGRTLENPSPNKIQSMIGRIFADALKDGQLDDSELTFSELDKVAQAFMWVLTNMYHHRIEYPGFDFNRRQNKRDSGSIQLETKTVASER